MDLNNFSFIPLCLQGDNAIKWNRIDTCLSGSLTYWIQILLVLVGIAAFLYLIYGAIQMATAFGNESKYTAGKSTVTHALLGVIVAGMSFTIVNFTVGFLGGTTPATLDDPGTLPVTSIDGTYGVRVVTSAQIEEFKKQPTEVQTGEQSIISSGSDQLRKADRILINGARTAVYFVDNQPFKAELRLSSGGSQELVVTQTNGKYWIRTYGETSELNQAKLIIYQDGDVLTKIITTVGT